MKKDVSIDDFKVIGLVHNPLIYLITTAKCILAHRLTTDQGSIIVFKGSGGGK